VQLAKRVLDLSDMKTAGPWSPDVESRIISQYEAFQRDFEESKVSLQAQVIVSNALFGTELETPTEPRPMPAAEFAAGGQAHVDSIERMLRDLVPAFANQCVEAARTLANRLER
jgi:hypothetical protein